MYYRKNATDLSVGGSPTRTRPTECPNPYSLPTKMGRVFWGVVWMLLFRPTPRQFGAWRKMLLRLFGAKIARTAWVHPSVRVAVPWKLQIGQDSYLDLNVNCYSHHGVRIGERCTISQDVFLCSTTHDYTVTTMPVVGREVVVEDDAWLCAGAFLAPGVTVGHGAIVGARAAVFKEVEPWTVVGGNPAKFIKHRELRHPDRGESEA